MTAHEIDQPVLRTVIVGTGANGASVAADLIEAGQDVTLVEQWPAHVEAMRADGLVVRWPERELVVHPRVLHLCQVAELRETFDVVLLMVKAYDARWAAELVRPLLAADSLVAGVQNGMTAAAIADVVGEERAVGTVIEVSSTMTDPGVVERHTPPADSWFAVGRTTPSGREERIAGVLRHAGRVEVVDDIVAAKWMKLVSNCTTLVTTGMTGLSMADAIEVPGLRELMLRAGQEALDVGQALGLPVLPIFGLPAAAVDDLDAVVETLLDALYTGFVRPGATTTVLQDWTKGRRSEAGDLHGEVVRHGAALGIPTPASAAILATAHGIERGELAPSPDLVGSTRRSAGVG